MQCSFAALEILCSSHFHPLFPLTFWQSLVYLLSFAFSRMSCSWNYSIYLPFWFMFQNQINKSLSISKIFFLLKCNYQALIQNHLILLENYDPMEYIVHGILQVRILELVAFPFYQGIFQFRD